MEFVTLFLFSAILILFVYLQIPIIYALSLGLLLFICYAKINKHSWQQIISMLLSGIKTVKNILIVFILIGFLTALWRSSGTIPTIITYAIGIMHPKIFLLMTFLLNCGVSFLTGTAFGTAATMGVICTTIGTTIGINPVLVGGAILSGVFFGDRCSPISTSAILVSELTQTKLFANIRQMFKTAMVSFFVTCLIYLILGLISHSSSGKVSLDGLFIDEFKIGLLPIVPAIIILVLSIFRIDVKLSMLFSILSAFIISIFYQGNPLNDVLHSLVFGYHSANQQVGNMINGGGILSMVNVFGIVCISSAYTGIFKETKLLENIKILVSKESKYFSPFFKIIIVSIISGMIACNQALTIMMTHQLCKDLELDRKKLASDLENTAVLIAPLIPWSIASAVPLASANAPMQSIFAAFFLILVPIWNLIISKKI